MKGGIIYSMRRKLQAGMLKMAFTPGGVLIPFDPVETDIELGKKLDISEKL